ncbi:MAG: hypothetical protein GY783_21340 [Gammaproteobacteria bacterium]|nr:hypothetical protein [Gammaproteobacteria bacterium]
MAMKVTRLTTYCTADQADALINFLDIIRDALWETYGDEITEMYRENHDSCKRNADQHQPNLDDEIPF